MTVTISDSTDDTVITTALTAGSSTNPDFIRTITIETNITQNTTRKVEQLIEDPDNTIGDGTIVTTTTASDGTITMQNEDYSTTVIDTDGTRTTTYSDGTVNISNASGGTAYRCDDVTYIPIVNARGLQEIEGDKNYCLATNITLTENFEPIGYPDTPITTWIQHFTGTEFTGTLDGNGKKIIGLKIEKENNYYIGLFAKIGTAGVVRDLIIEQPDIHGGSRVGTIAGQNEGTIDNVSIEGSDDVVIVKGENWYTGGIVGESAGSIRNSYATGAVSGTKDTGGLAGFNRATITESYFDTEGTGQTNGIGYDRKNQRVTGITTSGITGGGRQPFQRTGWDFSNTWKAIGNRQWPELAWQA